MVDENSHTTLARLRPFRAHHPERDDAAVPRRLRLEECSRLRFRLQRLQLVGAERRVLALVRVDAAALRIATLERGETFRTHPARRLEVFDAFHVHLAPDALRCSWRKANRVAVLRQIATDAIDPTDRERLVECLRIRDARLPTTFLVETDQQFGLGGVMLRQPLSELVGRAEEFWLRGGHTSSASRMSFTILSAGASPSIRTASDGCSKVAI